MPHASEDLGIHLTSKSLAISASTPMFISGKYTVALADAGVPPQAISVPKHIVLVVTRGGNYQSVTPFSETVVFEDDVHVDDQLCRGKFNINVFEKIAFGGGGEYCVFCSLGEHVSNTLQFSVADS